MTYQKGEHILNRKTFKKAVAASSLTFGLLTGLQYINLCANIRATSKNLLKTQSGEFYQWKGLSIYYTKKGTSGSPVILLHDLTPSSSSVEWEGLEDLLSKNHRVYSLDLPGCGRSDKPELLYSNIYYVQFLKDFIKDRICEKSFVVASGFSSSFALLSGVYDSSKFSGMLFINPPSLVNVSQIPTIKSKIVKQLYDLPLIGTFIYNMQYSRQMIEYCFTEKYLHNVFLVNDKLIDSYYESAHLANEYGKHLQASICGKYLNIDLEHALKSTKIHTDILIGTAIQDKDFVSRTWKYFNPDINIYKVAEAKKFPHFDEPELTASFIEKSIHTSVKKIPS